MTAPRTGAERYFAKKGEDSDYKAAYDQAKERIDHIDLVVRALDERRADLNLTKADVARRAGVKPEVIRRLFSAGNANPTLRTLVAIAGALDLEFRFSPRATPKAQARSSTRRRRVGDRPAPDRRARR